MIQALLWDVDGTLAETERDGHRVAFNQSFRELGLPWQWSEADYGALLSIAGGLERILFDMARRVELPEVPVDQGDREALARSIHRHKHSLYAGLVASGAVSLREGVVELMDEATARGLRQGIVTTSGRRSVDALLHRHLQTPGGTRRFDVVVCGDDVVRKKPHPEAYLQALEGLGVDPARALALEDSPPGVEAATAAGIPVVMTRSFYFADARGEGAVARGPGLHLREGWSPPPALREREQRITLDDLLAWRSRGRPPPG
jgi:HAD superfamily hydrolase (TIGR01509 family)